MNSKLLRRHLGSYPNTTTYVDFFLNAAGPGIRLKDSEYTGLHLDIGIRPGEIRKPDADKVKEFLAGTPDVANIIQPFVSLGREVSLAPTVSADLAATIGATWINGEYAAAFHSVHYPTATLEEFHADNGLRDVHTRCSRF